MGLRDRLVDPRSPDRRPRRAAYALPTLFTAGNIFLGYLSILRSFRGAMLATVGSAGAAEHFAVAAKAIGAAVLLDGLDGRIARMTNTTSDFGREMDSLADVISFGIAPAVLAFAWGVQFVDPAMGEKIRGQIFNAGYFIAFLFLLCGAARLARFNIQKNPIPKNPGRPDRKYFVGLPIPAAAAMVAAVVFAFDAEPLAWWPLSRRVAGAAAAAGFPDGQHVALSQLQGHQPFQAVHAADHHRGRGHYLRHLELLAAGAARAGGGYVASGIVIRIGGIIRRRLRHAPPAHAPEHQVG